VEHIQKQRLDHVVAVVAEGDLGGPLFGSDPVEHSPAQARAQAAHGFALRYYALDGAVGVLLNNAVGHTDRIKIFWQHLGGKARLLLVEIHRQNVEVNRGAALEVAQNIEQRVGVFAAGDADHDAITLIQALQTRSKARNY